MRSEFENSIKWSSSYEKLVYQHGERLFIFDDGKYKIAAVQLAWEIFKQQQSKVDELQKKLRFRKKAYKNLKLQLESKVLDAEIDEKNANELQKQVDAALDRLTELKEKSEALHHRWHILGDSVALAEAEMIDMCVKELEQALKGGEA